MGTAKRWGIGANLAGPAAWLALCVGTLVLGASDWGQAADEQTATDGALPPVTAPASAPLAPIPIERISLSATAVARLLRGYATDLRPDGEVQDIRTALPVVSAELETELERGLRLLQDHPSLEGIQTQETLWQGRQHDLAAWLDFLTDRAARLQAALNRLDELGKTWALTQEAAQGGGDPAAVLQQIDSTVSAIAATVPLYRAQRDAILDLQAQIALEVEQCEAARTQIQKVQQTITAGLFVRDSRPLWSAAQWTPGLAAMPNRLHQLIADYRTQFIRYLKDPSDHLRLHLWLFVGTLIALLMASRRVQRWAAEGEDVTRIAPVFDHPFTVSALLGVMYVTISPSPETHGVMELLRMLSLIPLVILVRPFLAPRIRPAFYGLASLLALGRIRHAFGGSVPLLDQTMIFAESLAAMIALVWLLRQLGPQGWPTEASWRLPKGWGLLAWTGLALLSIGLIASLLGYLRLARLTTPAVLLGFFMATWLYTMIEVGTATIAFASRVWPLRHLHLVRNHRERLLTQIRRWLLWGGVLFSLDRCLDYLGLWEPTRDLVGAALAARLTLGAFSTSAGEVLAFTLTLWGAYLLSVVLRFVLEEDVYPRTGIPTGISYAASSLLFYAIAILAFVIALGFLGITLTQVTLFAGALGIGVGLGLQGVVQNFVAGLILLFEQPIHLGDAVQVGELQGRVRRIGIRASIVRTVQGAEVIIPNSQLTSKQVINWTLSDRQRRLDLAVGLSYGSEPRRVIALLEEVARAHHQVLTQPPPHAIFTSYGDNAINFELRVWTDYDDALDVRSDLAAAVYDAVNAAGMSFPSTTPEVLILPAGTTRPP
jgi:small-conductance mechanosensitive channel